MPVLVWLAAARNILVPCNELVGQHPKYNYTYPPPLQVKNNLAQNNNAQTVTFGHPASAATPSPSTTHSALAARIQDNQALRHPVQTGATGYNVHSSRVCEACNLG